MNQPPTEEKTSHTPNRLGSSTEMVGSLVLVLYGVMLGLMLGIYIGWCIWK